MWKDGSIAQGLKAVGSLTPLASTWGAPGIGSWITVYANAGHAYMTVAGLRFDTSAVGEALNQGSGPRWRATTRASTGYTAKFFPGL